MPHARPRERGHFHHNNDCMIVVAIIGILAAIAIPNLVQFQRAKKARCLANLAAMTEGAPPEAACPASGQAYAAAEVEGVQTITCPAPAEHVDTAPTFRRPKGGAWTLSQTLPPYAGGEIVFTDLRVAVSEEPGRLILTTSPTFFQRWISSPFLALMALLVSGFLLWVTWNLFKEKSWIGGVIALVFAVLFGWGVWAVIAGAAVSTSYAVERGTGRVTRSEYVFGSKSSEKTLACFGAVPVIGPTSKALVLVHAADDKGARTTRIAHVAVDRLDIADWLNRALTGP